MKDIDNSCEKPLRCSNNDDETWIDTDDENDANEKSVVSRFKVSDSVQANQFLSDESINNLLIRDHCIKGRKCTPCPNDGECGDVFGSVKTARETIRTFRRKYWDNASAAGMIFSRRKQLIQDLDTMKLRMENSQTIIQYKIDGRFVCKSFFQVSTIAL